VVTREELQRHVWPADTFVDFDRGLNSGQPLAKPWDTADSPAIGTLRRLPFIAPAQNMPRRPEPSTFPFRPMPPLRVRPTGLGTARPNRLPSKASGRAPGRMSGGRVPHSCSSASQLRDTCCSADGPGRSANQRGSPWT
jgi:hypothetical protein